MGLKLNKLISLGLNIEKHSFFCYSLFTQLHSITHNKLMKMNGKMNKFTEICEKWGVVVYSRIECD